jgi:hypothetical protein
MSPAWLCSMQMVRLRCLETVSVIREVGSVQLRHTVAEYLPSAGMTGHLESITQSLRDSH